MQAHRLGALEDATGKGELHHRLAAGNGQTPTKLSERRRKAAEAIEHLLERDVGAVLEVPSVWVVAVRATEQAPRDEQHSTKTRSIIARRRLIGVTISE